jgi:hypothetical protein
MKIFQCSERLKYFGLPIRIFRELHEADGKVTLNIQMTADYNQAHYASTPFLSSQDMYDELRTWLCEYLVREAQDLRTTSEYARAQTTARDK